MSLSERMWPPITNAIQARAAAHNGAAVAFFIAGVTTICALLAISLDHPVLGVDSVALVDSIIFSVVGWRLTKESFPWAVFGLAMYLFEKWDQFANDAFIKHPAGLVMTVTFTAALIASVRGTYFLRVQRKAQRAHQGVADLPFIMPGGPIS